MKRKRRSSLPSKPIWYLSKPKLLFIPHDVPSSKNSKVKTKRGVFPSKAFRRWENGVKSNMIEGKDVFREFCSGVHPPIFVGFHFIRRTRRIFDFNNMSQGIQDLMAEYDWIADDNVLEMYPVPLMINGNMTSYDKEDPGVVIKVFNSYPMRDYTIDKELKNFEDEHKS